MRVKDVCEDNFLLIIDRGYWEGTACIERGIWMFSTTFISATIFLLAFVFLKRLFRIEKDAISSAEKSAISVIWLLFALIIFGISAVTAVARNRSFLFVENGKVVEQGCKALKSYEDAFPLQSIEFSYVYKANAKGDRHLLLVRPSPETRILRVDLVKSQYLGNLAIVAPSAMLEYARKLQKLGQPLPAELLHL